MTTDGQRPGNRKKLTSFLRALQLKLIHKKYTVLYDFVSKLARKPRLKGIATLNQTEEFCISSVDQIQVPIRKFPLYGGSSGGSAIGPVVLVS